jgi:hypothetical protein
MKLFNLYEDEYDNLMGDKPLPDQDEFNNSITLDLEGDAFHPVGLAQAALTVVFEYMEKFFKNNRTIV